MHHVQMIASLSGAALKIPGIIAQDLEYRISIVQIVVEFNHAPIPPERRYTNPLFPLIPVNGTVGKGVNQ